MLIAIAIVVILLVAARHDLRDREPPPGDDRHAVARDAQRATSRDPRSTSRRVSDVDRDRSDRPRARPTRPQASLGGDVPRPRPAATSSSGSRSTRKSSASRAGSSSTARVLGVSASRPRVLGIGILGFLWPTGASGFGGKVERRQASTTSSRRSRTSSSRSTSREAKTYLGPYPPDDLPAAKKVPSYKPRACRDGGGHRRAVPAVRAPRLPRAVVPVVAVVRVPVPRVEVQRASARSVTAPRRAGSTASSIAVDGGDVIIDTGVVDHRPADRHQHHQAGAGRAIVHLTPAARRKPQARSQTTDSR